MSLNESQTRIDIELAGQKIPFVTSAENAHKLKEAATAVNEQIMQITATSGNRSIERAALMTAIKLAGEVIDLKKQVANSGAPAVSYELVETLANKLSVIEQSVDNALFTLSLPGTPRSIVP